MLSCSPLRRSYRFGWAKHGDWRELTELFAKRIITYDFWDDPKICGLIPYDAAGLRRFFDTGQPGIMKLPTKLPAGFDPEETAEDFEKLDVFEL